MGSLFSVLNSTSQSLQAFEPAMDVTENNVTNANSPGYADQVPQMISQDFQSNAGPAIGGGVQEVTQDTRSTYADTAVQQQLSLQGMYQQLQTTLAPLQNVFDVSSRQRHPIGAESVVPELFAMEHAARATRTIQSAVIDAAQQTASAFQAGRRTSSARSRLPPTNDIQTTVAQINQDAARHSVLQPADRSEFAAQRRIERTAGKHLGKSFQPGQHPGGERHRRTGHGAARGPDGAGGRPRK